MEESVDIFTKKIKILCVNDWPGQHSMVEYVFIEQGGRLYGFYYSPDNVPLAFQNAALPLEETPDGWRWRDGRGSGETRQLAPRWFLFSAPT